MDEKQNIKKELEGLSPKLAGLKNQPEGYTVPKDYFKSLPDEVLGKIRSEKSLYSTPKQTRGKRWLSQLEIWLQPYLQPRYALAFAAILILVAAAAVFLCDNWNSHDTTQQIVAFEDVSIEAAFEYIHENIEDFDTDLLLEMKLTGNEVDFYRANGLDDSTINKYLQDHIESFDEETFETLF